MWMRRLICAFIHIWQKQVFSWRGSYCTHGKSPKKIFKAHFMRLGDANSYPADRIFNPNFTTNNLKIFWKLCVPKPGPWNLSFDNFCRSTHYLHFHKLTDLSNNKFGLCISQNMNKIHFPQSFAYVYTFWVIQSLTLKIWVKAVELH